MTVVMLKHVTNQSEYIGLHKLLFHRRLYTLWLFLYHITESQRQNNIWEATDLDETSEGK